MLDCDLHFPDEETEAWEVKQPNPSQYMAAPELQPRQLAPQSVLLTCVLHI
jgi:hypothetical protein